eukprot:6197843-Pleurochrysis_carterae.AAC.4
MSPSSLGYLGCLHLWVRSKVVDEQGELLPLPEHGGARSAVERRDDRRGVGGHVVAQLLEVGGEEEGRVAEACPLRGQHDRVLVLARGDMRRRRGARGSIGGLGGRIGAKAGARVSISISISISISSSASASAGIKATHSLCQELHTSGDLIVHFDAEE